MGKEEKMSAQLAFQKKLQELLLAAKMKNGAYSLRAFARRAGIGPAALSEILNGKRRVSKKGMEKVLRNLCLSPAEIGQILDLYVNEKLDKSSEDGTIQNREKKSTKPSIELAMDQFHTISDWYHFAILSLSETDDFDSDEVAIARRLNIGVDEVKMAIARLIRLNMLSKSKNGKLKPTGASYNTTDDIADIALKKAHLRNLELAQRSLEKDSVEKRDFVSMTMAIDIKKLPKAKKMIREFRQKLSDFLEDDCKNEVYKICINLFPLTQTKDG